MQGQGFLFSRPLPNVVLPALLDQQAALSVPTSAS